MYTQMETYACSEGLYRNDQIRRKGGVFQGCPVSMVVLWALMTGNRKAMGYIAGS